MGIANCCFIRDKDDNRDTRTQMLIDYLNRSSNFKEIQASETKFKELALSDAGYDSAESLDENQSRITYS